MTFTSPATWLPGWTGRPEPMAGAAVVVPAYLAAYGPASMDAFAHWLASSAKKADVRAWFAELSSTLAVVDVEGERLYLRDADVDSLARTKPTDSVRLLPGFDQYVLGQGTANTRIIAAARRSAVSRTAGWISPVVVSGGRVVGTWEVRAGEGEVRLFGEDAEQVDAGALAAEIGRVMPDVEVRTVRV